MRNKRIFLVATVCILVGVIVVIAFVLMPLFQPTNKLRIERFSYETYTESDTPGGPIYLHILFSVT